MMIIIGAGLSGLLAGALDRHAEIFEKQATLPNNHSAVLRFRSDKIAKALDIPFRKVRVIKGVVGADWVARSIATPKDCNEYSRKTVGRLEPRSIDDLSPVERFVAPGDFVQVLAEMCSGRISYNSEFVVKAEANAPIISTIPLPSMLKQVGIDTGPTWFRSADIFVRKFVVKDADAYQTLYFSSPETRIYRATLTGQELIVESVGDYASDVHVARAMQGFGIDWLRDIKFDLTEAHKTKQSLGKITPLPAPLRQGLLYRLSSEYGVYSLGRYACWRNILLDDVFDDYFKVRRMISLQHPYAKLLEASK